MSIPKKVTVTEVGPRDGFQSVKTWIETADKIAVILDLFAAGVDRMEAVSFISPKAIPQMRDAAEVVDAIRGRVDMDRVYALVGNLRGAQQAFDAGVRNITFVISASEAHNLSNVRRTPAESLALLAAVREELPSLHVKLALATAFGCPFTGEVGLDQIRFVLDGALALGVDDVCLCDTIGVASPLLTERLLGSLRELYGFDGALRWSMHFHNTRGFAAANTYAALKLGIDCFETAAGGLGGCPFAPGASGNMATEDLVYMLRDLGIECGVDLDKTLDAAERMSSSLNLCTDSRINRVTMNKIFPR